MSVKGIVTEIYYRMLDWLPDALALQITGLRKLGYWMDIARPVKLNEKINWRKLYQKDPRFDTLSDKEDVKSYIREKVGEEHVVPTLWCGADFDAIPWDSLPYPLVIKSTHSTGDVFFIQTREDVDRERIRTHFAMFWDNKKLKRFSRSTHESKNKRYIIEPFIGGGEAPADYKFLCFDGRVHFVHLDEGRFSDKRRSFYDRFWNYLPIQKSWPVADPVEKPQQFELMVEIADCLSQDFDFVRVDLYVVDETVYCGELTFTPGAGFVPFVPREWDTKMGYLWRIK
ncbi:ATP-grasp fold amidoligase family protein [Pseudodesulfovibrio sediminis]|uniref:Glycosyl transferase n=1 Tax=Pseudodesulfovibrio sediminis TaxID=2810563 RepID=A0ABM7P7X7_9BACT|nr:ATP-grasp fold amidoligase family protein [Pseudodesulfovibrio sediminis]BCS89110.1 hypothetical protein PSDVSF_23520 [Pseudodesulfovibrio sediminis]